MQNDSVVKTFVVAAVLCLVCSIMVSTAAVQLRPVQEKNKLRDRHRNILAAMGLWSEGASVEDLFAEVQTKYVDLETGEYVEGIDPKEFSQKEAARDPERSIAIPSEIDSAGIKRRSKIAAVYLYPKTGGLEKVVLPVHGKGLWSTMYGYLALGADLDSVEGFSIYEHGETPGLGGEVDNPAWKAQWKGKQAFGPDGEVRIQVKKGVVDLSSKDSKYEVDGLSGATITSRGVTELLRFWLSENGFGPYLNRLRNEGRKTAYGQL